MENCNLITYIGSEVDCNAMSIREVTPASDWLSLDGSKPGAIPECGCDRADISKPTVQPIITAPITIEAEENARTSVAKAITLVTSPVERNDDYAMDITNSDDDGDWYPIVSYRNE